MVTFSSLPPEIHYGISERFEKNDLISLCCTSKWVKDLYLPVLYHHVDLRLVNQEHNRSVYECMRQQWFVNTLLSHPGYGSYIRSVKGIFCIFSDSIADEELWRAMNLLTHVQSVDVGSRSYYGYSLMDSKRQFPTGLFRSATSVTLAGRMPYNLAKSILDAVNPAMLKYLCLERVRECGNGEGYYSYIPGDTGEDGRIIAYGAISGLLTTLTGRCTALRTLILRRIGGQPEAGYCWHAVAEEASYNEWASFIRSVQGTVEKLTFTQSVRRNPLPLPTLLTGVSRPFRIMDETFRRLIIPAIVSGNWPCLSVIELQGVRSPNGQVGNAALTTELRALLGGDTEIVVEDNADMEWNIRILVAAPVGVAGLYLVL